MVEAPESDDVSNAPHFQVSFYSSEKILLNFPETIFNVPSSSGTNQFNLLVNKAAEEVNEDWENTTFDFLIDSILLRTSLLAFVETAGLSGESVIKVQCILREPAPVPDKEFFDSDWVSDLKATPTTLFSVNYGGELCLWSLKDGKKLLTKTVNKDDTLKCLDLFKFGDEQFVVAGSQNQTLTMFQITELSDRNKSNLFELTPQIVFRGHQRSVECVSAKPDGTRLVSGSFDHCLKVWNTVEEFEDNNFDHQLSKTDAKRAKVTAVTKVPMVTLQSHREAIVDVQWNPLNEKQVITASWDHTIITWDLELAGTLSTMNSNKAFNALSVNKETGLILTGSTDPAVRLWDSRSREGSFVKQSFLGHKGWVSDVCWAPNAENLFVSSSFDASVKLWDTRSPRASLFDLLGHGDRALAVDWSNEGVIASGGADSTIKTFRRGTKT